MARFCRGIWTSKPRSFSASSIEETSAKCKTHWPGRLRSTHSDSSATLRGAPESAAKKTSPRVSSRSGKSVSSRAATSPLLPRARRILATVTNFVLESAGVSIRKDLFLDDFKSKAAVKLHAGSAEQRAHGLGGTALAADDLTQILGVDSEFDNRCTRALDRSDFDFFRMIHEGPSDGFDELFHQAPPSQIQTIYGSAEASPF